VPASSVTRAARLSAATRDWRHTALLGAVLFSAGFLLPADHALVVFPFDRYGEAFVHGAIPYRDFYVEYPPGAISIFTLPALVPGHYELAFRFLQLLFGVTLVALVAFLVRYRSSVTRVAGPLVVGAMPFLLGPVVFFRYDLWPALLVTASLLALERRGHALAGSALGAAVAAKIFAVVLLPLFLAVALARSERAARRLVAGFIAGGAVFALPFVLLGPGGVAFSLRSQFGRGLQIESLGGSALLFLHTVGIGRPVILFRSGSLNVVGGLADALAVAESVALVAVVVAISVACWRRRGDLDPRLVSAALVLATIVFAKVLSPQYLVWIVPLVAICETTGGGVLVLLCVVLGLSQLVYPTLYDQLVAGEVVPSVLLVTRNVLLFVVMLVTVRAAVGAHHREPAVGG